MAAPNILLVMSDQHRADMLGCAGDSGVHDPFARRSGRRGARFTRVTARGRCACRRAPRS